MTPAQTEPLERSYTAKVNERRKDGLLVFYAIADPSIFELCELVCSSLEKQLSGRTKDLKPRR